MKSVLSHLRALVGRTVGGKDRDVPFEELFIRFREVLDHNNRALEIITDMGEKLGGDYLFDIVYIRNAYDDLVATIKASLLSFDLLTQRRYPKLHDTFDRIDSFVRRLIDDIVSQPADLVVALDQVSWDIAGEVGGKGAALTELRNSLKVNVPDGFAVTTRWVDEFLLHAGLDSEIAAVGEAGEARRERLEAIRARILSSDLPPELGSALEEAINRLRERCNGCSVAVRSSAEEEDSDVSFAGQFATVLNVPLETAAVGEAVKQVVASLFSEGAAAYQEKAGYTIGRLKMAAACVAMVDAAASGVVYTVSPNGESGSMIINASWGLGTTVVEGRADVDLYRVRKDLGEDAIVVSTGKNKEFMETARAEGGTEVVKVPDGMRAAPCLSPEKIRELAVLALYIEKRFGRPQDIEWAMDREGVFYILQSRPITGLDTGPEAGGARQAPSIANPVVMRDKGTIVQKGVGAGAVFMVQNLDDLDRMPRGAVLVSRSDSSQYIRVMPFVGAIITDIGTATSHMASLCREFRVPTIVNAGDAMRLLRHGQEVTVAADDDGRSVVYDGVVPQLVGEAASRSSRIEDVYEYRKKRYILRHISLLNLVDPLMDDFIPEKCKTVHDILRFIHEKSVYELIEKAREKDAAARGRAAVRLDIPIPAGIIVVDIGNGLSSGKGQKAGFDEIVSVPLKALVAGMMHPGAWHAEAVSLNVGDFLGSMMRMPDIMAGSGDYVGNNIAIASREYVNLSLRFGYHFTMVDCYCGDYARSNHIYFRFAGGATDIIKRSRRVELISVILKEFGFRIGTKGDLVIARMSGMPKEEAERVLDQLGRLIAFTRQLDAVLNSDSDVERFARNFMGEDYSI